MRVPIDVEKMERIGHGRVKVKVKQRDIRLDTMRHNDVDYVVVKTLGRGRYIMRRVDELQA